MHGSTHKPTIDWENRKFSNREISNLMALSKSYGYIRYFYPNPNLDNLNWNNFLFYAQKEILGSNSDEELITKLTKVFYPLCEEVQFTGDSLSTGTIISTLFYINEHRAIGTLAKMKYGKIYIYLLKK